MWNPPTIQLRDLVYREDGGLVLVYADGKAVVVEPGGSAFLAPALQEHSARDDSTRSATAERANTLFG
jgi:hypothetical protein